ncbi:MAG: hypothetical protein M1837_000927 [Sclerophora amabilis]|nr:MAG: hypothetical protein M1837_000927 [Sclerophora amabilis]
MVSLTAVRESNSALPESLIKPTAVFVGATSGIGEATVKQFAAHTTSPKVYLVGRNRNAATSIIAELNRLNPDGIYEFIQADVSMIRNVDAVCEQIKGKEKKLDVLFLSAGYVTLGGRIGISPLRFLFKSGIHVFVLFNLNCSPSPENGDGIESTLALRYYIRLRFVSVLIPLLLQSPSPRVIAILAGGKEAPLKESDLELRHNYSVVSSANHSATMTTLSFEHLASLHPSIRFVHNFPGVVKTNIFMPGNGGDGAGFSVITSFLMRWIALPLLTPFTVNVDESGERQLFHLTSAMYPSASAEGSADVPLPAGLEVAKGSDGEKGSGVYLLEWNGESTGNQKLLREFRERGMPKTIWEHTTSVYDRVTSGSGK